MSGQSNRAAILGVTPTSLNTITALAGGGIGATTPVMTEALNRVTTVATIGDSVALPPATAGLSVAVTNAGANALDIFPALAPTGDVINALAAATALRINVGATVVFSCTLAGTWQTMGLIVPFPAKFTSINVTVGTLAAGVITGAAHVTVLSTNATPGNQTTRTAAQMFADAGNVQPGDSYLLTICNSGAGTLTLLAGSNVTLGSGTYTVPTNTCRIFVVTFTTAAALTIQTIGVGTWS